VSTDFLALCLFCFNIRQHYRQTLYFKYMWTAANFIIEGRVRHYGRRLCTVVLICATVIYTHAEAFLRQAQNCRTFFDQLPIRVHYPTGFDLAIAKSSV